MTFQTQGTYSNSTKNEVSSETSQIAYYNSIYCELSTGVPTPVLESRTTNPGVVAGVFGHRQRLELSALELHFGGTTDLCIFLVDLNF
uniref:SFRICE_012520 n=1 Tax=Spodoptera frugiperda TaxID=7108 RepID=A0A2H1V783_SPOFR